MQSQNKLFDDFVKVMNGAAGTIAGMTREANAAMQERAREWIGGLDLVSREEFEAVKAMAVAAREQNEALAARIAALEGAKPADWSCPEFPADCQSSFVASTAWSEERTSVSRGLASGLAMPNWASEGPVATIATCCGPVPFTTNPPIITSVPVCTRPRVEMFMRGTSGAPTS